jgi:hypothetical protein
VAAVPRNSIPGKKNEARPMVRQWAVRSSWLASSRRAAVAPSRRKDWIARTPESDSWSWTVTTLWVSLTRR